MTHPIDTAYVDIVPVDKSLEKLQRDIDKAMKKIDKEAEKDLRKIDKNFDDTFKNLNKYMDDMEKSAERHFRELENIVDNSMGDVTAHFDDTFDEIDRHFAKMGDESDRSFKRIRNRFLEPLQQGLKNVGAMAADVGRSIFQVVSGVGGAVGSNPLMALIIVLTPALIALAAALSQLIGVVGLIPAGFAVALTAIIPLVVAFQNFGEAVSALADGDLEKIDEAMKKLSPSAGAVAREIAQLLPMLKAFQRAVQESFFSQIRGDVFRTMREIFPTMDKGFNDVAAAMGRLASMFLKLAASKSTIQVFQELFATTTRIIEKLSPPFIRFADMLLNTVHEALPFVERIAAAFGRALDTFSAFVNKSIETGDFDKFIEDAITTIKELIRLGKELGKLIGTIFDGTETSGHEFLQTLTDIVIKINEFLQTEDGRRSLELIVLAVQALGAVLLTSAQTIIFFTQTFFMMMDFLEGIGRGFVAVMSTIIEWVTLMKDTLVNDFNNIVTLITNLPAIITGLAPRFLQAGKNLIQSFMTGFRAVGGFIGDVAGDIVGAVKGFLNRAIDKVNQGIEIVDNVLPGSLGRVPRLAEGALIRHRPGGILANIGEGSEDEVVAPLSKLEGMIQGGPSVTFGAGAINLNFSGAVPTASEARGVGQAVGQGIIDMITKRNMRVQVRAV